jgi:capsule biosynthesis phosphatase
MKHHLKRDVICIPIDFDTRGAVETVMCAINSLDESMLHDNVAVVDCDTFYEEDIISTYKNMECKNAIGCFVEKSGASIFSFVSLDDEGQVVNIEEKKRISDLACSGFYCFESMAVLKRLCENIILNNTKSNNEFYISLLYRELIKSECVKVIQINNPICVGTPLQLRSYCSNRPCGFDYRICFDLDNTLVSFPTKEGDYSTVKPITKNIEYLRFLKSIGCTIIINTARKMKTAGNNVETATRLAKDQVYKTLQEFDIPYDEIYFGKPYAHVYIDDLSANAMCNLEKQVGMYNTAESARKSNSIAFLGDHVVKNSNDAKYQSFYYENVPPQISNLFPALISKNSETSITIEKINGVTISNLYVNKSLLLEQLDMILSRIETIHSFVPYTSLSILPIYKNYAEKVSKRYNSYDYSKFSNGKKVYESIMPLLAKYENENRGQASIIHGDPVFSNMLLTNENLIRFIDVRGNLGGIPSIYGDRFYDYAKILQSIVGYEFIVHDYRINDLYISPFYNRFMSYITERFGEYRFREIKAITSSLFFSLIPIHDNEKCCLYCDIAERLLDKDTF